MALSNSHGIIQILKKNFSYFFSYLTSRGVLISGLLYQQRHFDFYNQLDLKDDMQNRPQ